jgi:hypothetical protein
MHDLLNTRTILADDLLDEDYLGKEVLVRYFDAFYLGVKESCNREAIGLVVRVRPSYIGDPTIFNIEVPDKRHEIVMVDESSILAVLKGVENSYYHKPIRRN